MKSKTILITGGTDGIGKAIALKLATPNDNVTIIGRNVEKGKLAQQAISETTGATVVFAPVDMSIMTEVQHFADTYLTLNSSLDYLVHCAGVIIQKPVTTPEGLETVFATQFLSRYLLTNTLIPMLGNEGKVIFVSGGNVPDDAIAYDILNNTENFSTMKTVLNTSRAQSLYTLMLITDHPELCIYNYGPGLVKTSIARNMSGIRRMIATLGQSILAVSPEHVAEEIATLLTQTHDTGWYKRGLIYQKRNDELLLEAQQQLRQFADDLLQTIISRVNA